MSDALISILLALGAGGWFFNKLQQTTGRADMARSASAAAVASLLVFLVIYFAIRTFVPK